ncbi:NADP-dependent oxidoreductase domain-containing protein [Phlebopus sp. FC_14]|nr:NADP-dependent oxidoreductase domain-containing protein [Phlebopus sp. FC_14]
MSLFPPVLKPASRLARYRALSPLAGIHVSPLQLGAMSIGDKWEPFGFGSMDRQSSFRLLDAFYEAGGNFIDTANAYQDQTSEQFIGEWAEQRGIRDQLVIATKYSTNYVRGDDSIKQKVHYTGNCLKSMHISVEASLKKLRTSYIDILYVHWWDFDTSVAEVMNGLHTLVQQGKVLYLGISDTPAWIVAKANQYAQDHGKSPFVIYQGAWNVMAREFERDILPMCRSEGLALAPFNVLAAGKLRTDAEEERRRQTGEKGRTARAPEWERNATEKAMSAALEKVAKEVGTEHITAVAIAYVMQKAPYALSITLTPDHIKYLESMVPLDLGFPHTLGNATTDYNYLMKSAAFFERQPQPQPMAPSADRTDTESDNMVPILYLMSENVEGVLDIPASQIIV